MRHKARTGFRAHEYNAPHRKYRPEREMNFEDIHKACVDKRLTAGTERTAKKAAEERGLNYYRCPFCGNWHLTSQFTNRFTGRQIKERTNNGNQAKKSHSET